MRHIIKELTLALALSLLLSTAALAETPPCSCSVSSSNVTLDEGLDCFLVYKDDLDACYGNDVVISVNNTCTFDVTIQGLRDFSNPEGVDRIIAAGDEDSWQEVFTPTLGYEGDTSVSMTWTIEAEGTSSSMGLDFVGACVEVEESLEGCQGGSNTPLLWLSCLLFILAMKRQRRRLKES